MSRGVVVLITGLFLLGYVIAPGALIWGWVRWWKRTEPWGWASGASFSGMILASGSALLAVATFLYATRHPFGYYDPTLLRIYRWGLLSGAAGFQAGLGGIWRKSSVRWFAPAAALGAIAFWVMAAASE